MLGVVYYPGVGKMPVSSDTAIKLATSAGTVIGQFGFGTLADIVCPLDPSIPFACDGSCLRFASQVGRKRMYGLELIIIIFATVAQALTSSSASMDVYVMKIVPPL